MEVSEYVRHLVLIDKQQAKQRWSALNQIFGENAQSDKGNLV
jgi:hypothetical protein